MINLRKFEFNALMQVLIHCVPWDPPSNESLLENYLQNQVQEVELCMLNFFYLSDSFTDAAITNVAQKQTNGQINERKLEVCMP